MTLNQIYGTFTIMSVSPTNLIQVHQESFEGSCFSPIVAQHKMKTMFCCFDLHDEKQKAP